MSLLPPGTLEAFGLYLVRTSALVLGAPLLGEGITMQAYKVALIVLLAGVLYSTTGTPLAADLPAVAYAFLAVREVLIGFVFAFAMHLAMMAIDVGGHMIGHEMAMNMSSQADPVTGATKPMISNVYHTFFSLAILAVDGHHWLLISLKESFTRAPVGELAFSGEVTGVLMTFMREAFASGLAFAAPMLVLLTLVSVLIALLTRAVPQLNMMEFGFNLRVIGGLLAMFTFAPVITPGMNRVLELLMQGLTAGLDALEG